jgi:hypothetical protein
VATSDDLRHWTPGRRRPARSQPSIVSVPDDGFVLAVERDTPDPQWVGTSNIVVRRYATWAALVAGSLSAEANLPRSLASTAEGRRSCAC